MTQYLAMVEECLKKLDKWIIRWVPQEENRRVDALVEITATLSINKTIMLLVYLKVIPSITLEPVCNTSQAYSWWMIDIIKYHQTREVSEDGKQAHKLCIQVAHFTLFNDQIYRWSFGGPYLKCLSELEVKYVITELHEGVCANHIGGRTLTHRTYTQGCYWPTIKRDIENYVKKCDWFQWHTPIPCVPSEALNPVNSPCPFT